VTDLQVPAWVSRFASEAATPLDNARSQARTVVDPAILELARVRIATLLQHHSATVRSCSPEAAAAGLSDAKLAAVDRWPSSPLFSETDRACLALAELFVIDVSAADDPVVRNVLAALGPAGLYGFVQALWVFDMTLRLEMSLEAVAVAAGDEEAL
jgi:hypothetical protein